MDRRTFTTRRRGLKRKLEEDFIEETEKDESVLKSPAVDPQAWLLEIRDHVKVLDSTFSATDRAAAKPAASAIVEFARKVDNLKGIVDCGAVPALVKHTVSINLPSHGLGACSLHLLSSVCGPICPVSTRCKVFLCRSVFIPSGGTGAPAMKSAAVVLTRHGFVFLCILELWSYDALRGSPVLEQ